MGISKAQGLEASSCSLHFLEVDIEAAFLLEEEVRAIYFRCNKIKSPLVLEHPHYQDISLFLKAEYFLDHLLEILGERKRKWMIQKSR